MDTLPNGTHAFDPEIAWHAREMRFALREATGLNPNGTPKA